MRINTQFPVAVHILSALAYFRDDPLPSDSIAKSIGTNPVVVRRMLSLLKKKGFVDTQSGVRGAVLRREHRDITLLDIYNAVRPKGETLFDLHPNPSRLCPVGAHISKAIGVPLGNAQSALEKELGASTLADVIESIAHHNKRPR